MKRSETVGQSSVNRLVAGLNLARGANKIRQFLRSSKPQISKADLCIAKSQVRPRAKRTNTPQHRWSISSSIADHPRLSGQIAHTVRVYPGLQSSYIQR